MSNCPICGRHIGEFTNDPILTTPSLSTDQYRGFTILLAQHIKEIQDERHQQEIDNGVSPLTVFSPIDITNLFQNIKQYILELRSSTEKILAVIGISLYDFLSTDEDGSPMTPKDNWSDSNLEENKYQCKAIHIEDLRHYISPIGVVIDYPNSINTKIKPLTGIYHFLNRISGSFIFKFGIPDTAILEFYGGIYPNWTIINNNALNFMVQYEVTAPSPNIQYFVVKYTKGINTYYSSIFSLLRNVYVKNSLISDISLIPVYTAPYTGWTAWTHEFLWYIEATIDKYKNYVKYDTVVYSRTADNSPPNDLYNYYLLNADIFGWIQEGLYTWAWRFKTGIGTNYSAKGQSWSIPPDNYFGDCVKLITQIAAWNNVGGIWTFIKNITITAEIDWTI